MRSPFATALLNPLNLAMLVFSALAGLIAAWWLFPLGLALWLVMVATIANDKAIRINYNMEARLGTLSSRFQEPYAKAVKAQMRIFNALLSANGGNKRAIAPVQDEIEALVNKIYTVCQQMTAPENFLAVSRAKNADLEGERALLVLSIDKSMAPAVLQEKQAAVKALDVRIQKTKTIAAALDHVEGQLGSTTTVMEALLADIMRLQVMGVAQTRQEVPALLQKLRGEADQLDAVEKEIARLA
jgi:hypothetical protein